MTIGERNKYIIRLHETGTPTREIAERLLVSEANVNKILQRYKTFGDKMFDSQKEYEPEFDNASDLNERERHELEKDRIVYGFTEKRDLLRDTVFEGDRVKFIWNDSIKRGTVCELKPHVVVVRDLKNPPCEKCIHGGEECEKKCKDTYNTRRLFDICREYWGWYDRLHVFTPTYDDLARSNR